MSGFIQQSRRAKAETEIRTTLSGLDASGALASFDRMEDKVDQQEARAAALGELKTDSVEDQFAVLEQQTDVESQLAALKARQGLAAPHQAKALEAGDAPAGTPPE